MSVISTPRIDRVRNQFLEREGTFSNSNSSMRKIKRNGEYVYNQEGISKIQEDISGVGARGAEIYARPIIIHHCNIMADFDYVAYFTNARLCRDCQANFEDGVGLVEGGDSCIHLPKPSGNGWRFWKRLEYHAGLFRLGMRLDIPPLGSLSRRFFKVIDYQIDEAFMDHRFAKPFHELSEKYVPRLSERYAKPIFVSSVSSQHGLTEDSRFPWPVIDMAEFEKSQEDQLWHRKVLIVFGLTPGHFLKLNSIDNISDQVDYITEFLATKLFSLLNLEVSKIVIPCDRASGKIRQCIFIIFASDRDAEIARNAVDDMYLPEYDGKRTYQDTDYHNTIFTRIRARLFHHYNRDKILDAIKTKKSQSDDDEDATTVDNTVESKDKNGKKKTVVKSKKTKKRNVVDILTKSSGSRNVMSHDIASDQYQCHDSSASESIYFSDTRENEVKSKASKSNRFKNSETNLERKLFNAKGAEIEDKNSADLEELRYKLSATELVNDKLRCSARERQDGLMERVRDLERQLRDSVANEKEICKCYNDLLAQSDAIREKYEASENRLIEEVNYTTSEKLISALLKRNVGDWIDVADSGTEAGFKGDALLLNYQQNLKMVVAKIDIAREDLRKREQDSVSSAHSASNMCAICMENPKTHLLLPCRHLVFCESCFNRASEDAYDPYTNPEGERQGITSCPVCRAPVRGHMHIFN